MDKKQLFKEIEDKRNSKLITYVTSDRQGPMNAKIAMDIIPVMSKQLRGMGKVENLDLFLYSAGGDTMVPWRLVSMIREYCNKFSVLVPYKAHSAATMVSLGADEVVMSDLSELSPIDPSTANIFNPQDPNNPNGRIPISVEDVMAFFDLVKEKFGIKDDQSLSHIFNKFAEASPHIHPLALGNINRTHNLIRILARRLLKSHVNKINDNKVSQIVDDFTEKLYSHQYFIGRKEAKEDLGLEFVQFADGDLSRLMTNLYDEYRQEMQLEKLWNPEDELGLNVSQTKKDYLIAVVESSQQSNRFEISVEYKKQQINIVQQTPQGPIQIPQEQIATRIVGQGWK